VSWQWPVLVCMRPAEVADHHRWPCHLQQAT
jgi:hypothetical protein